MNTRNPAQKSFVPPPALTPTHLNVFTVEEYEGNGRTGKRWTKIGAAFPTRKAQASASNYEPSLSTAASSCSHPTTAMTDPTNRPSHILGLARPLLTLANQLNPSRLDHVFGGEMAMASLQRVTASARGIREIVPARKSVSQMESCPMPRESPPGPDH
jgi:hypothetical protein